MAVYLDRLYPRDWGPRCFRDGSCHMWADSLVELHEMARRIGLRRGWFQDNRLVPHYDLTPMRSAAAIRAGAIVVSLKEFIRAKRQAMMNGGTP